MSRKDLDRVAEALEAANIQEEPYFSDYSSSSDYTDSDVESDDQEATKQNTSGSLGKTKTTSAESDRPKKNTQVLKEKTDLLERYANKINVDQYLTTKKRITRDKAERATVEQVLDPRTRRFLGKLFNNGTITEINGCVSTGKEANVYHALNEENGREFAVKIYKTSILVFKDRERYVDGEFRFRNTKNQSNPRKMVKVWAEKEFRNLRRLYTSGIPSPEPIDLKSHVLVMEFLNADEEGNPSPKLRDYQFKDIDEVGLFYHKMLIYMRWLYKKCRLIHADLSEYNSIVHKGELYIFDVSQSVEPDHQMSTDFLRMDIKNVNDFFSRTKKINVYAERFIFRFIVEPWSDILESVKSKKQKEQEAEGKPFDEDEFVVEDDNFDILYEYLQEEPLVAEDDLESKQQDEIFRSLHLVSSLNHLEERDFQKFTDGQMDTLLDLVAKKGDSEPVENRSDSAELLVNGSLEEDENDSEEDSDNDSDEDSNDESDEDDEKEWVDRDGPQKGKKHEDKDAKKERKAQAKEEKKKKRETKMKKHVKKKLVRKSQKGNK